MKTFVRYFCFGIALFLLPIMVVCGIYIADKTTRETGFSDRSPIYEMTVEKDKINLTFAKKQFTLPILENKSPLHENSAEVLIKRIADLIGHQLLYQ